MLVAAVFCLCAAAATGALGAVALARPDGGDSVKQILRAVAPTQLAAALILAAGAVVALVAAQRVGLPVLIVSIVAALGTVAAGCWQGAKYVARMEAAAGDPTLRGDCQGACGSCTLSCDR